MDTKKRQDDATSKETLEDIEESEADTDDTDDEDGPSPDGALDQPVFAGSASIAEGRLRHLSLPNALDAINGTLVFDARSIRLDDLSATLGGGPFTIVIGSGGFIQFLQM